MFQKTVVLSVLATLASAQGTSTNAGLNSRSIVARGGWSLSAGNNTYCPAGTSSCFTDQTGIAETSNRGQECCPSGTSPELFCGTYVNTGQPYACCPMDNPDCRGDVEKTDDTDKCANSGWALWHIPDGGFNSFCCLPGQYGYWYKSLGQDAVGQCSNSSTLPDGSTPGVQDDNGDGSVNASGVQVSALPTATPTPAPTCDVIHYGWSLQVANETGCTEGSSLCSYGGSCCPTGLNCGTVIGDSEVPVCCPANNPDCRGDVEGLWPQVCADSSWALWHVNTNGNHFCCLPGQIGYNVPGDNAAVGYCGSAVPNGTMRSILDYEGDGSRPGSNLEFPCDTNPAPNASYTSLIAAILNPAASLNPFPVASPVPLYPNATAIITAIAPALTSYLKSLEAAEATQECVTYTTTLGGIEVVHTSTNVVTYTSTTDGSEVVQTSTEAVTYTSTLAGTEVVMTSTKGVEVYTTVVNGYTITETSTSARPSFTSPSNSSASSSLLPYTGAASSMAGNSAALGVAFLAAVVFL